MKPMALPWTLVSDTHLCPTEHLTPSLSKKMALVLFSLRSDTRVILSRRNTSEFYELSFGVDVWVCGVW